MCAFNAVKSSYPYQCQLFDETVQYDGPNGSLFISILLHNSEFRIPKFALRISEFEIPNCEVYIIWASGNSQSTLEGILNSQANTKGSTT